MIKSDLERIGIPAVDATGRVVDMHSLRHGYIQTLCQSGVPLKTLQGLARHADPKTTFNIYVHVTESDKAAAWTRCRTWREFSPGRSGAPGPGPRSDTHQRSLCHSFATRRGHFEAGRGGSWRNDGQPARAGGLP